MEITLNGKYERHEMAYATIYDGYVYLHTTGEQDDMVVLSPSELAKILAAYEKTGWHNDGSAVA